MPVTSFVSRERIFHRAALQQSLSCRPLAAAAEAMRLQPNLAESHLALGYTYYYGGRDYDRALAEFEIARRDLPNDAGIFRAISAIERRQGKWQQSIEHR